MTLPSPSNSAEAARNWVRELRKYRDPSNARSAFELAVTLVPFLALWSLSWWAMTIHWLLPLPIAVLNGLFLVRIFAIQHDCGHAAFFHNGKLGDWTGRALGVLTLTPYDVWQKIHAMHHSNSGNLDQRDMGEIFTLTTAEYAERSRFGRFTYRLYRNPFVLFVLGPGYLFFMQNRLPIGLMRAGFKYWVSAMGTNAAIVLILGIIFYFGGAAPILLIFVPTTLIAATIGVWLFYVQHQFEETHWDGQENWQVHEAALHGSSHYVMPSVLQWLTANIGVHHVHHLYSRIPFYRLPEVLRDHAALADAQRLTIRESFATARLHLWDEKERRLLSFRQAREQLHSH
ncbi:MAG: fatty acid desaturase [Pseudomonadota bacterium]